MTSIDEDGHALVSRMHACSLASIEAWGEEPERWMVVEESGELLDSFAKLQRGRADVGDLVEEAADAILVSVHACAIEGIPADVLFDALMEKLERAEQRAGEALWHQGYEDLDEVGQEIMDEMLERQGGEES